MNKHHIAQAWRDDEFRESLSPEALAQLPESPIGEIELSDRELGQVDGAQMSPASVILSLFSGLYCNSIIHGGSCGDDTQGCC